MTDPECVIDTSARVVGNLTVTGTISSAKFESVTIQASSVAYANLTVSTTPLSSLEFTFYKFGPFRFLSIPRIVGSNTSTNSTARLVRVNLPLGIIPANYNLDITSITQAFRSPVVVRNFSPPVIGVCYFEVDGILISWSGDAAFDIPPAILTYRV